MIIYELLNKDPNIVPKYATIITSDSKSSVFMAKNGKDANHTSHIARRVHSVRNGEN